MIVIPTRLWPSDLIAPPTHSVRLTLCGETMGTTWSVDCFAPFGRESALRTLIEAELARLVAQMSHWREDSVLSQFNRAAAGEWVPLPDEFRRVLTTALEIARRSGGAFDPTLGRQANRWGFGPSGARTAPPPPDLPLCPPALNWRHITMNENAARQPGGAWLDLSAIAKGYAVDHVCQLLNGEGLVSYLVEIGGELRARGVKPGGQPWWVSVEPPPGLSVEIKAALSGWAIATSGDYRRYFDCEGRRYAHTLEPRTGQPLAAPPASVSVMHAECMAADAWSTALTVLGEANGLALCEREGLAAVFVHRDPFHVVESSCFREMLS